MPQTYEEHSGVREYHAPTEPRDEAEQRTAPLRSSGGFLVSKRNGEGIGVPWLQFGGVMAQGRDALAIVTGFAIVTLTGEGVGMLARELLDRRVRELREGMIVETTRGAARIESVSINYSLPLPGKAVG